ncbi:hypothetical protein Taro_007840 [Colocasia esculenta]|uniref:Uncharacterized protein n=1 Tax=Colocasia esculenta TaxID=4460 RepID=A0A843TW26_COLES|nr:hypothetical protein [Colocasia esculenta]
MANSQTSLFNSQEAVNQISKTRLSFAHLVDDLESMKNLSAHIDSEMSALKKELKNINKHGPGSSSFSVQPSSVDLSAIEDTMSDNSQRLEEIGQTFLAKVVSTHLLLVSTQCFKAKAECCRNGEVDTLWKLCDLKSLLDTWHSRDLVDRPSIVCPRPPRVLLDILVINTLLIGHPTAREQESLQEPSRNPFWRQRELSYLVLLPLCFFNPIPTSPSTRSDN